tara:strand:- start:28939 stop:29340 length:402 start_codon:yes stop_codon:yes gene_type:complete
MQKYVLGFAFNNDLTHVVLIKKNRPDFLKNKLNGVGGKIEPNENIEEAMVREFKEETGIITKENEWRDCGEISDNYFFVKSFYVKLDNYRFNGCSTQESEEILKLSIKDLDKKGFNFAPHVLEMLQVALFRLK